MSGKENYKFINHSKCEYFPCHKTANEDEFNCLFCYCPLYTLREACGGDFKYTQEGIKDCSDCMIPHRADSYEYIMSRFEEVVKLAEKKREEDI